MLPGALGSIQRLAYRSVLQTQVEHYFLMGLREIADEDLGDSEGGQSRSIVNFRLFSLRAGVSA